MAPFWSRRKETGYPPGEIVRYIPSGPALVVCQECKMAVSLMDAQQVTVRRLGQDPTNYTDVQEFYCPTHRREWDLKELRTDGTRFYRHRVEVTEAGRPYGYVLASELYKAERDLNAVIEGQRVLQKSLDASELEVRELRADLTAANEEAWQLRQELVTMQHKRRRR